VLLVAAKKDMINDYTSVVSEAGLQPVVVDVDAFAVQNSFEVNYDLPKSETVVLVNAGASAVNINVLANGLTTFTRDVTIGGGQPQRAPVPERRHRQGPRALQGDQAAGRGAGGDPQSFQGRGDRQPPIRPQLRDGRRAQRGGGHRACLAQVERAVRRRA